MTDQAKSSICTGVDAPQADGSPTHQDLTREIARLQHLLAHADKAAMQYAIMLREGDHRIKNSLQIVASLMRLQAGRESNDTAREVLRSAAARVQSVAHIHDALQQSEGNDVVDLGGVLGKMCESLHAMAGDSRKATICVSVEQFDLPIAVARPIVLIVNELVVNALRHAFPGERTGSIRVDVAQENDQLHVVVADDGCGLPAGYAERHGYGMKLVHMMAQQIHGTLLIESGPGCRFTIVTPALTAFEAV